MISIIFLDGANLTVKGDQFSISDDVFVVGQFFAPIANIRFWEVLAPEVDIETERAQHASQI